MAKMFMTYIFATVSSDILLSYDTDFNNLFTSFSVLTFIS